MSEARVYYCMGCGAPLNISMNRSFVFCQMCGCKNEIPSQEMQTKVEVCSVEIEAKTDADNMLSSVEYAISIGQYDRANEMLLATILSGTKDHRVYILKAKIDLLTDNNKSLFESMKRLQDLERAQSSEQEVTKAICELMQFRGMNGVTVLHNATFHELMDMVIYCVEHGSDVNCVAGRRRVTPISIMFASVSRFSTRLDGTPFVHNKQKVKEIRDYLMSKGAQDRARPGYEYTGTKAGTGIVAEDNSPASANRLAAAAAFFINVLFTVGLLLLINVILGNISLEMKLTGTGFLACLLSYSTHEVIAFFGCVLAAIVSLPGFDKVIFSKERGTKQRMIRWGIVLLLLLPFISGVLLYG